MVGQSFCKVGVIEVVFDGGVVGVDNLCLYWMKYFKELGLHSLHKSLHFRNMYACM